MAFTSTIDADRKVCTTCQYWQGEREPWIIGTSKPKVRYNNANEECTARKQKRAGATGNCPYYKKWVELP